MAFLSRLGAAWCDEPKAMMLPDEMDSISEACGMVLDKWMPTIAGQYGAEVYLVVALGQWGGRLMAIRKVKELERREMEKAQNQAQRAHRSNRENLSVVTQPETVPTETSAAFFDVESSFGPVPQ